MELPNLTYIKELSGGDKAFENQILGVIKSEFPKETEQYYAMLKKQDFQQLAASVHKLRHKISILGLEKDYALASTYEDQLKQHELGLQGDFEMILHKIHNFLEKNQTPQI